MAKYPAMTVSNITEDGFWLQVDDENLYLPYTEFPCFLGATQEELLKVERHSATHFHWPLMDMDICLDSIKHPEKYPLRWKRFR